MPAAPSEHGPAATASNSEHNADTLTVRGVVVVRTTLRPWRVKRSQTTVARCLRKQRHPDARRHTTQHKHAHRQQQHQQHTHATIGGISREQGRLLDNGADAACDRARAAGSFKN